MHPSDEVPADAVPAELRAQYHAVEAQFRSWFQEQVNAWLATIEASAHTVVLGAATVTCTFSGSFREGAVGALVRAVGEEFRAILEILCLENAAPVLSLQVVHLPSYQVVNTRRDLLRVIG